MSELATISTLLDEARKRRDRVEAAVSAFRELPFEEQLQFLVTVEDEVVIASGTAGAVLALGGGGRRALPAPPPEVPLEQPPAPAPAPPVATRSTPDVPRRGRFGPEVVAQVCELFDQGLSQGEVCKRTNISYPTVNKMLRAAGRNTSARTSRGSRRKASPKSGSTDAEDSHPSAHRTPRPQARQHPPSSAPPSLHERAPNPKPIGAPAKLLRHTDELDMARQLEELEIAAWERVLGPDLAGDPDVAEQVRALKEGRQGMAPLERVDPHTLRRADSNRKVMDAIVAIVRAAAGRDGASPIMKGHSEELQRLARDAHAVRHHFVSANIRLVGKISQKYYWTKLAHEDLMQEGMMGLMHSIGMFDHRRGLRFSTYATWWIKHAMMRSWENGNSEVRVPVHVNTTRTKLFTATRRLRKELRREPTEEEIAKAAGMTVKALRKAGGPGWWLTGAPKSFDYEITEDGGTLADAFADPESEVTTLHRMIEAEGNELVLRALATLRERDQIILRRRFGIDCEPMILADVGDELGLTRERIRQLETVALSRLRRALEAASGAGIGSPIDGDSKRRICA